MAAADWLQQATPRADAQSTYTQNKEEQSRLGKQENITLRSVEGHSHDLENGLIPKTDTKRENPVQDSIMQSLKAFASTEL